MLSWCNYLVNQAMQDRFQLLSISFAQKGETFAFVDGLYIYMLKFWGSFFLFEKS